MVELITVIKLVNTLIKNKDSKILSFFRFSKMASCFNIVSNGNSSNNLQDTCHTFILATKANIF